MSAIHIDMQTRIQVLSSLEYLPSADKEQRAAFIVRVIHSLFMSGKS